MLTQSEADALIDMEKRVSDPGASITFPFPGSSTTIPVESQAGREPFLLDIECGNIIKKWKLQLRYRRTYILVRIDIGGFGRHRNPPKAPNRALHPYEGEVILTPHLQRYVEGYDDAWALPLPSSFSNPDEQSITWREFLIYCNIQDAPALQVSF